MAKRCAAIYGAIGRENYREGGCSLPTPWRWAEDDIFNGGLCSTDTTHGLKLANDNQHKRNSGSPTARQWKAKLRMEDSVANQYAVQRQRWGFPVGGGACPCGRWGSDSLGQHQLFPNETTNVLSKNCKVNTGIISENRLARFRRGKMQGV